MRMPALTFHDQTTICQKSTKFHDHPGPHFPTQLGHLLRHPLLGPRIQLLQRPGMNLWEKNRSLKKLDGEYRTWTWFIPISFQWLGVYLFFPCHPPSVLGIVLMVSHIFSSSTHCFLEVDTTFGTNHGESVWATAPRGWKPDTRKGWTHICLKSKNLLVTATKSTI